MKTTQPHKKAAALTKRDRCGIGRGAEDKREPGVLGFVMNPNWFKEL
ncbi:hypothetical protein [Variovorax sp. LjRoot84]